MHAADKEVTENNFLLLENWLPNVNILMTNDPLILKIDTTKSSVNFTRMEIRYVYVYEPLYFNRVIT